MVIIDLKQKNTLTEFGIKNPVKKIDEVNKKMDKEELEKRGFKKQEDTIFKFENEGDSIEGVLKSKEPSKTNKNNVYKIEKDDVVYTVFGTTVLDSKLEIIELGKEVVIIYTGTKENKNVGQNDIKLFDVYVK